MTTPRSAKESGNAFPYGAPTTCYIEVTKDGAISSRRPDVEGLRRAQAGESRFYAVWPGNWRSDLFAIDDLDACAKGLGLSLDEHVHEVLWAMDPKYALENGVTANPDVYLVCGCDIKRIDAFAKEMRELLDWNVRTSVGWGGWGGDYTIPVARGSLRSPKSEAARIPYSKMRELKETRRVQKMDQLQKGA